MTIRSRFLSVLFWSVIAAAFIGPGTVTSAASAGAGFQFTLLWALAFSTLACLVLQEASARITVVSGSNLGQALTRQYPSVRAVHVVPAFVMTTIVLGCAAYQAGNILGAVAGLELVMGWPRRWLTLGVGSFAFAVLWLGSTRTVATLLGLVVAVLGLSFLTAAVALRPPIGALVTGSLVPALPEGSGLLVIALVGTTVVPYNLFLGSGLPHAQTLREMRFGLAVAIVLGGVISMGILVVGTAAETPLSFQSLSAALEARLGPGARWLLGIGLFAAGASSAITAPLAAAITARSVLGGHAPARWHDRSRAYRLVWAGVLLAGVSFGVAEVQPVPVIIAAQALNGVVLPFVAVFLLIAVNDRSLMGGEDLNRGTKNVVMTIVVFVTLVLGVTNVMRAAGAASGMALPSERGLLALAAAVAALLAVPVARTILRRRRSA